MSEKKKVNIYARTFVGLLIYFLLFAWLNNFELSGFNSDDTQGRYSLIQKLAVCCYILIGLLVHLISIRAITFLNALAISAVYLIIGLLAYFGSSLVPELVSVGILGLSTLLYAVFLFSWLQKLKADSAQLKNIAFHLILSLSLQLVILHAQAYSNILFITISIHWLYILATNVIYGMLSGYTSPVHSVALLVCKQNFRYSGIFFLSVVFSLALAIVPRHLMLAHDIEEAFVLVHSWFFNFLVLVSITSILLLTSHSVNADFVNKNIYTIITKPISQIGYLSGKFLGVVLVVAPFIIYFSLMFLVVINTAVRISPNANDRVNRDLFSVSEFINPDYLNSDEFILAVDELMRADGFEGTNNKFRDEYIKKQIEAYKFVPFQEKRTYKFKLPARVAGDFDEPIYLVFTPSIRASNDLTSVLRMKIWINGSLNREANEDGILEFKPRKETRILLNEYIESGKEEVTVELMNVSDKFIYSGKRIAVYIGKYGGQGLELAIEDRSYLANCFKLIALMLAQLFFVATLSLFAVSMLDFSVAILFAACLLVVAYGHDFINDAVEYDTGLDRYDTFFKSLEFRWRIILNSYNETGLFAAFKSVIANVLDAFLAIMPSFKSFKMISDFSRGIYIEFSLFVRLILTLCVFWSPLYFLLSTLIMRKREPARMVI